MYCNYLSTCFTVYCFLLQTESLLRAGTFFFLILEGRSFVSWNPETLSKEPVTKMKLNECLLKAWKEEFKKTIPKKNPQSILVQFSHSVVSDSLRPHESQHARPPCSSPTPGVHSNSHPSSRWCHPAISSSVVPFSSCPQSLPASESFPMNQLFAWGGQSTGVGCHCLLRMVIAAMKLKDTYSLEGNLWPT